MGGDFMLSQMDDADRAGYEYDLTPEPCERVSVCCGAVERPELGVGQCSECWKGTNFVCQGHGHAVKGCCEESGDVVVTFGEAMAAADAYARAARLAGHVEACGEVTTGPDAFTREQIDKGMFNRDQVGWLEGEHHCGDNWHCPKALEILQGG